jgi:hypothetical protein
LHATVRRVEQQDLGSECLIRLKKVAPSYTRERVLRVRRRTRLCTASESEEVEAYFRRRHQLITEVESPQLLAPGLECLGEGCANREVTSCRQQKVSEAARWVGN